VEYNRKEDSATRNCFSSVTFYTVSRLNGIEHTALGSTNKNKDNSPSQKVLSKLSDLELVNHALETGENCYLGELYDRYANKVYGKCIQMVRDKSLAQDLSHDILVKTFLKLHTFNGKCKFGSWLYQISYTHCIDYIRKNKHIFQEELEEDLAQIEEDNSCEADEKELVEVKIEILERILSELRAEERALVLQKYQDNFTIEELATIYKVSGSSIKMKLKRVRDKIKRKYKEYQDHDESPGPKTPSKVALGNRKRSLPPNPKKGDIRKGFSLQNKLRGSPLQGVLVQTKYQINRAINNKEFKPITKNN
jgi:RNA polymerase sigma factor (sigma-70 family)